ncbi:KGGVGR-motif variant AAA ATPase [Pseudomonas orientalis]|uniref:KGGVGR-motif variant AAA ATPase n=1 Tax=Pseudomonas orientalis TaxID=76758 RepID=UPI0030D825B5
MAASSVKEGKIVTFYSYKGGVGRTMSLANTAFLAAANGIKVLVMDWDLEAPGLAYYFRGLLEPSIAKELKDSAGLLDVLYGWRDDLTSVYDEDDVSHLIDVMGTGEPFADVVRQLVAPELFDFPIVLDYIGAGGRVIGSGAGLPYEEALAQFSWTDFFDQHSGGFVLESLKKWAKSNYDLILIDSRTGFADVAGICAMQLPDELALCFVLNRQNIDGIARVSAAIRDKRQDEIVLRAVPMRVHRSESSEGSDATARAIAELTKVGGFSRSAILEDIKNLSIRAYDDVPFYETLSVFVSPNPQFDGLSLSYLSLASKICGQDFSIPDFDQDSVSLIKKRLAPKLVTIEYLGDLSSAEPERALEELNVYIESAYDAVLSGEAVDNDYLKALVHSVGQIAARASPPAAVDLRGRGIDLLRALYLIEGEDWKPYFIVLIQDVVDFPFFMEQEQVVALLEELDVLLSDSGQVVQRLRRISYRRQAARILIRNDDIGPALQALEEILTQRSSLLESAVPLATDQVASLQIALVDTMVMRALIEYKENSDLSLSWYFNALNACEGIPESDTALEMLKYEIYFNLATKFSSVISDLDAAEYAIEAVSMVAVAYQAITNFDTLSKVVLKAGSLESLRFCEASVAINELRFKSYLISFFGRHAKSAQAFLDVISDLAFSINCVDERDRVKASFVFLSEMALQFFKGVERKRQIIGDGKVENIFERMNVLQQLFHSAGVSFEWETDVRSRRVFSKTIMRNSGESDD